MKLPVRIGTLVALCACSSSVAMAQNLAESLDSPSASDRPAWRVDPGSASTRIAPAGQPESPPAIVIPVQNPATLGTADELGSVPRGPATDGAESLPGWMQRTWPGQMTVAMALVAAGVEHDGSAAESAQDAALDQGSECFSLALRVGQKIKDDPNSLLETVAAEVSSNPGCACEVVKSALTAASPDSDTVAQVVEAAAIASPESLRIVAQCAIAVRPESLPKVQAILARLDPNGGSAGKGGAKDAKATIEKAVLQPPPDPLDRIIIVPPPPPPPPVTDPNPVPWCPIKPVK